MKRIKRITAIAAAAVMAMSMAAMPAGADWVKKNGKTYYEDDSTGKYVTGIKEIDGETYYFSKKGVMQTGWIDKGKNTYYFSKKGAMAKGWKKIDGETYYFSSKGAMKKGTAIVDGAVCLFDDDGVFQRKCANEIVILNNKKYYVNAQGKFVSGFKCVNGEYYYFGKDGAATSQTVEQDGKIYVVDEDGLVSVKDKPLDVSDIKVRFVNFSNSKLSIQKASASNTSDGYVDIKMDFKVTATNASVSHISFDLVFKNKNGKVIDTYSVLNGNINKDSATLKTGGRADYSARIYVGEPVYIIGFSDVDIY